MPTTNEKSNIDPTKGDKPWLQIILAIIGSGTALIVAFLQFSPPNKETTLFSGRVFDEKTSNELKGVKITLEIEGVNSPTILTDSDGRFSFKIKDLNQGIRVRAKLDGYEDFNRLITPSARNGVEDVPLISKKK
jgi:hypothetical protein